MDFQYQSTVCKMVFVFGGGWAGGIYQTLVNLLVPFCEASVPFCILFSIIFFYIISISLWLPNQATKPDLNFRKLQKNVI